MQDNNLPNQSQTAKPQFHVDDYVPPAVGSTVGSTTHQSRQTDSVNKTNQLDQTGQVDQVDKTDQTDISVLKSKSASDLPLDSTVADKSPLDSSPDPVSSDSVVLPQPVSPQSSLPDSGSTALPQSSLPDSGSTALLQPSSHPSSSPNSDSGPNSDSDPDSDFDSGSNPSFNLDSNPDSSPNSDSNSDSTPTQSLEAQNIFDLLDVSDSTRQEKEDFLDELQEVIWEDFVENNVSLLLTETELKDFMSIKSKGKTPRVREEMLSFLEKLIPNLEEIMRDKALELKRDLVQERIAGMKEFQAGNKEALAQIAKAQKAIADGKWGEVAPLLNGIK